MKKLFLSFALTLAFGAISSWAGSMTDSRDGQTYKTVKIGKQVWMAENLNYEVNDGEQSWCYDNKKSNCKKYGRLYTWKAAKKACPAGWHLPSKEEWETLFRRIGGEGEEECEDGFCWMAYPNIGKKLKSTSGWNDYVGESGNGTDAYGFSALPAGGSNYDGDFSGEGYFAYFWSSSEGSNYDAYDMSLSYDDESALMGNDIKDFAFSVRCLQN